MRLWPKISDYVMSGVLGIQTQKLIENFVSKFKCPIDPCFYKPKILKFEKLGLGKFWKKNRRVFDLKCFVQHFEQRYILLSKRRAAKFKGRGRQKWKRWPSSHCSKSGEKCAGQSIDGDKGQWTMRRLWRIKSDLELHKFRHNFMY